MYKAVDIAQNLRYLLTMARIKIPAAPLATRLRNQYKPHFEGGIECLFCDSPVKKGAGTWVHLLTTGELVDKEESPAIDDTDLDQGLHIVGSECIKKVPAEYRFGKVKEVKDAS